MCGYCKYMRIRNSEQLKCDISQYTRLWRVEGIMWGESFARTQILSDVPVKYCPACGRKLGD